MEIAVHSGRCPEGRFFALSVALCTQLGHGPASKAGDNLVQKVHLIGEDDFAVRVGAPNLANAKAVRPDLVEEYSGEEDKKYRDALRRCKLVLVFCEGNSIEIEENRIKVLSESFANKDLVLVVVNPPFALVDRLEGLFKARVERKNMLLLFAATTFSCSLVGDAVVRSSHGALLLERVPRNGMPASLQLMAVEACLLPVVYRSAKYRQNWMFGSLCWHLFDAFAAVQNAGSDVPFTGSLYEQLSSSKTSRLVFAQLIEESLTAVSTAEVFNIDSAGSPLGCSLLFSKFLLRLPQPMFVMMLWVVCTFSFTGIPSRVEGGNFGRGDCVAKRSTYVNGMIRDHASAAGLSAPLNSLILDRVDLLCNGKAPEQISPLELERIGVKGSFNPLLSLLVLSSLAYFVLYSVPKFFIGMFVFLLA